MPNTSEQMSRSGLCEGVIRREATETEGLVSYILKRNGFFIFLFFCLSGNYFGTGKGYKLEIWQEGVV